MEVPGPLQGDVHGRTAHQVYKQHQRAAELHQRTGQSAHTARQENEPAVRVRISSKARQAMAKAYEEYDKTDSLRQEKVRAGQETMRNWQGLTSEQLDRIADDLTRELQ